MYMCADFDTAAIAIPYRDQTSTYKQGEVFSIKTFYGSILTPTQQLMRSGRQAREDSNGRCLFSKDVRYCNCIP